jgi:predicted phage replisome organizer
MSNNKKYYYLKLKDSFFNEDAAVVLESMKNGYIYSNIRFKLYLKSLKYNGKLMMTDRIPYNSRNLESLAKVIRSDIDHLRSAIKIFKELDIIEILDSGEMYMLDIQNFIGHSSTEADRKREYRIKLEDKKGQKSDKSLDKNPPELKIKIKIKKELKKNKYSEHKNVLITEKEYNKLITDYGNIINDKIEDLSLYLLKTGKRYKSHYATIQTWLRKDGIKKVTKDDVKKDKQKEYERNIVECMQKKGIDWNQAVECLKENA